MRVLIYGADLNVGGTQTNAIELAAELRDRHGLEVAFFAGPGEMLPVLREKRLPFYPAPARKSYPCPVRMQALREAVRAHRADAVHAWEWAQCLDAFFGARIGMGVPLLCSHMMMDLLAVLPKTPLTTYVTPELCERARAQGRRAVVLLHPVDTDANAPGAADGRAFRERFGLADDALTLVTVSRLCRPLKGEALFRCVAAVEALSPRMPVQLVVVGDGELRPELMQAAERVNAALGRRAVVLTGGLLDPRPAYAAADIAIGMGSSAVRAMAFAKPLVVVGEQGFSVPFSPATARLLVRQGMYGRGPCPGDGRDLPEQIESLAADRDGLAALGEQARAFAIRYYGLDTVSVQLKGFLDDALAVPIPAPAVLTDGARSALLGSGEVVRVLRKGARKLWRRRSAGGLAGAGGSGA